MSGIDHYINDVNTRLNNLLFNTQTEGVDDYTRQFWGLARIDIDTIPRVTQNGELIDVLLDDNYDISSFFVITGDEKLKPYATETKTDLIVMVNMRSFSDYTEEDIIEKVYQIVKVTAFGTGFDAITRDVNAIKEFKYEDKIQDTMYPFFVFRIKSKLLGILKQK